jgi:uncharacterized protein YceK
MMKYFVLVLISLSLTLSGCASSLYRDRGEAVQGLYQTLDECQMMVPSDARDALKSKASPLSRAEGYKEADFADVRMPTDDDLPWIRKYQAADEMCMTALLGWSSKYASQSKPLVLSMQVKHRLVYDGLLHKEVTYGFAKKSILESNTDFVKNLVQLEKDIEVKRSQDKQDLYLLIGIGALIYSATNR